MVRAMPGDAVTLAGLEHPALFGKLPGHGDFIARGVPGALRERLDSWLSEWLAAGQAAHSEGFVGVWEGAAPWLFEGPAATAVLLPSMDAVGRHFPLLAVCGGEAVTQDIYDAMIDAVIDGADSDTLRTALAALAPAEPVQPRAMAQWFLPDGAEPDLPAPDNVPSWPLVEGCFV